MNARPRPLHGGVIAAAAFLAACTVGGSERPSSGVVTPVATSSSTGQYNGALRQVAELPAPPSTAGGTEQPIAVADTLEIFVFQVPDLSRTVQVDSTGRISLPLVGALSVAGKPLRAVEAEITRAYSANYLQNPQITVAVKDSVSRRVTIDGEVGRSGVYPLPPTASLLDAIALGGGLSKVADEHKVYVYRDINGRKLVANYDVGQIRAGQRSDPRLYGGDVVVVFSSGSKIAMQNLKEALGVATPIARLAIP
jgi:polysaccharide export outer membrane protein